MPFIRFICRALAVICLTVILYIIFLTGNVILCMSQNLRIRWCNRMVCLWAKSIVVILGIHIIVKGIPPKPPFFLVSNHLSYIDVIIFFTQINCVFVAKSDVERWPFLGRLSKSAGTLFIDRLRHRDIPRVNTLIEDAMSERDGVMIFPESTSSKGEHVLPFKSPLLEFVASHDISASFATMHYQTLQPESPAYLAVCWWGDMTFIRHLINLMRLRGFTATLHFGNGTVDGTDRKEIAKELWQYVDQQFVPTFENENF